ncbi:MAG: CPBP family intramembrane metalloprotease [Candidatus Dormibacteraeota bacterium]|nr:CPBP family intramembrane metalloprotease [Candidatus Dormibacteraeota bacterium]
MISKTPTRVVLTRIPDTWAWVRPDFLIRLLPFALASAAVYLLKSRPGWFGLSPGWLGVQLAFGVVMALLMFVAATLAQLWLARRRGSLLVPAAGDDAWFQAGFYVVNGPVEEAFFRGLIQGGLGALLGPAAGFTIATAAYVLYHRLAWSWPDTLATTLVGVPLGLAFWLLPGPPSILGVSIAHIGATCGFLGPGPYLLKRLRLV